MNGARLFDMPSIIINKPTFQANRFHGYGPSLFDALSTGKVVSTMLHASLFVICIFLGLAFFVDTDHGMGILDSKKT